MLYILLTFIFLVITSVIIGLIQTRAPNINMHSKEEMMFFNKEIEMWLEEHKN